MRRHPGFSSVLCWKLNTPSALVSGSRELWLDLKRTRVFLTTITTLPLRCIFLFHFWTGNLYTSGSTACKVASVGARRRSSAFQRGDGLQRFIFGGERAKSGKAGVIKRKEKKRKGWQKRKLTDRNENTRATWPADRQWRWNKEPLCSVQNALKRLCYRALHQEQVLVSRYAWRMRAHSWRIVSWGRGFFRLDNTHAGEGWNRKWSS